ncbi:hypothetical protein WKW80_19730 [Variovorax humicola]|uniref:Uncharacterized protein n=1 Tax=Variovorax humicola TaxID=1769758 RepID=A0ABU8W2H7_9BURK
MSDELSQLTPVHPDQGRCQWVQGVMTGIDRDNPVSTHTVGIPHLMLGTIIFVHEVNGLCGADPIARGCRLARRRAAVPRHRQLR